ncbi:MAG: hypothetical protein AABY04_02935 [Candidatus Micrarchaeota archaeon]
MDVLAVDWDNLESEYLCPYCHQLLYTEFKTKVDYCLTKTCKKSIATKTNTAPVSVDKEKNRKLLNLRLLLLNQRELVSYIYYKRGKIIDELFSKPLIPSNYYELLALGEILMELNHFPPVGRSKDTAKFDEIIVQYLKLINEIDFIEDIENNRTVIGSKDEILQIKYWPVFLEQYRNYGILTPGTNLKELFQYATLEQRSKHKFEFGKGDFSEFFKEHYAQIIAIKYILERYFRTKQQYAYNVDPFDIVALLGLFFSIPDGYSTWDESSLRKHLEKNSKGSRKFNIFSQEYLNGNKVPIISFIDQKQIRLHSKTLLFFIFYLVGLYSLKSTNPQSSRILIEPKEKASGNFEEEIREKFRSNDWQVKKSCFRLYENTFDYDVIAVKNDKSRICLVEAKYLDIPPSSISGITLLKDKVLDEQGEIVFANRHEERLNFFSKHFAEFKKKIPILEGTDSSTSVNAVIVYKWKPVLKKYRSISFFSLDESFIQ